MSVNRSGKSGIWGVLKKIQYFLIKDFWKLQNQGLGMSLFSEWIFLSNLVHKNCLENWMAFYFWAVKWILYYFSFSLWGQIWFIFTFFWQCDSPFYLISYLEWLLIDQMYKSVVIIPKLLLYDLLKFKKKSTKQNFFFDSPFERIDKFS